MKPLSPQDYLLIIGEQTVQVRLLEQEVARLSNELRQAKEPVTTNATKPAEPEKF